jgi:hypothetical protein
MMWAQEWNSACRMSGRRVCLSYWILPTIMDMFLSTATPNGLGHDYWLVVVCDAPPSYLLPAIIDRYVCFSANTRLSAPEQKDVTTNNLGLAVSNTALCIDVAKRHLRQSQYNCTNWPFRVLRSSLSKIATCKRAHGRTIKSLQPTLYGFSAVILKADRYAHPGTRYMNRPSKV